MGSYTQIMKKKMHTNHILRFVLLICLACCARGDANVCQAVQTEDGCGYQPTIDMNNFQIPEDFNLERVVEEVTKGSGWIVLKSMYSAKDVKLAKDIVYQYNKADNITMDRNEDARHKSRDEQHNKYNGLVWALFNKGRIFEKMAQHPVILNNSTGLRSGVLQHMVPVYIKPFEAMSDYVRADIKERASPAMRRVLALDHPYPVLKH